MRSLFLCSFILILVQLPGTFAPGEKTTSPAANAVSKIPDKEPSKRELQAIRDNEEELRVKANLDRMEKKVKYVLQEIVATQQTYVDSLKVLEAMLGKVVKPGSRTLTSPEEAQAMANNIKEIREVEEAFLENIKSRLYYYSELGDVDMCQNSCLENGKSYNKTVKYVTNGQNSCVVHKCAGGIIERCRDDCTTRHTKEKTNLGKCLEDCVTLTSLDTNVRQCVENCRKECGVKSWMRLENNRISNVLKDVLECLKKHFSNTEKLGTLYGTYTRNKLKLSKLYELIPKDDLKSGQKDLVDSIGLMCKIEHFPIVPAQRPGKFPGFFKDLADVEGLMTETDKENFAEFIGKIGGILQIMNKQQDLSNLEQSGVPAHVLEKLGDIILVDTFAIYRYNPFSAVERQEGPEKNRIFLFKNLLLFADGKETGGGTAYSNYRSMEVTEGGIGDLGWNDICKSFGAFNIMKSPNWDYGRKFVIYTGVESRDILLVEPTETQRDAWFTEIRKLLPTEGIKGSGELSTKLKLHQEIVDLKKNKNQTFFLFDDKILSGIQNKANNGVTFFFDTQIFKLAKEDFILIFQTLDERLKDPEVKGYQNVFFMGVFDPIVASSSIPSRDPVKCEQWKSLVQLALDSKIVEAGLQKSITFKGSVECKKIDTLRNLKLKFTRAGAADVTIEHVIGNVISQQKSDPSHDGYVDILKIYSTRHYNSLKMSDILTKLEQKTDNGTIEVYALDDVKCKKPEAVFKIQEFSHNVPRFIKILFKKGLNANQFL